MSGTFLATRPPTCTNTTSISKQPLHVLIWICYARRLQLCNEARAIQQDVITHDRSSRRGRQEPNATLTSWAEDRSTAVAESLRPQNRRSLAADEETTCADLQYALCSCASVVLWVALRAHRQSLPRETKIGDAVVIKQSYTITIHSCLMQERRLTVSAETDSDLRFHCGACRAETKPRVNLGVGKKRK